MSNAIAPWLTSALERSVPMSAHALLLHGPGDLGQFDLALALARAWLCEAPLSGGLACGHCASCRWIDTHSHPDLRVLLPEALREAWGVADDSAADDGAGASKARKTKPSREVKVDDVRAAIEWGQRTSARGRSKVILIHPADAMNQVAANALLKTLEEPPGSLRLLLTTRDPESLLPTVRSRCQRVSINLPSHEQAVTWLSAHGVARADTLLAAAGGHPPAARAMAEEGIDADSWERIPAWFRQGQAAAVAQWSVARVVEAASKLCHDLMSVTSGGKPRYFSAEALAPALRQTAPSLRTLVQWSRELMQAARHDEHPWNTTLKVEALVAQAAALWQTPRAPGAAVPRPLATLADR